jgi:hypothetical protein
MVLQAINDPTPNSQPQRKGGGGGKRDGGDDALRREGGRWVPLARGGWLASAGGHDYNAYQARPVGQPAGNQSATNAPHPTPSPSHMLDEV